MNPSYPNPALGVGSGGQPQQPVFGVSGIQTPVSSGSGDIVLAPEKKSHKKMWMILAVTIGAVGIIIFVVVMLSKGGMEDVFVNTGLRGAFNQYANYFLSGEVSTNDIEVLNDNNTNDNLIDESDEAILEDVVGRSEKTEEDTGEPYENEAFFIRTMMADYNDEERYVEKITGYFSNFKDYYLRELGSYSETEELINNYENVFNIVLLSRGKGKLTRSEILDEYLRNGDSGAEKLIDNVVDAYKGLPNVNGVDYGMLVSKYGQQELILIKKYQELGCVAGDSIDYECVSGLSNDESLLEIETLTYEYADELESAIDNYNAELYSGIYSFASIVYNEAEIIEELKNEE